MLRAILVVFLLAGSAMAEEPPADIPNLKEPREKVFTAGQPTEKGIKEMADRGVKIVVNLRAHTERNARDESAELKALGIEYVHIPVTPETYTLEKLLKFSCVLKNRGSSPVLLHCSSANRVAGMWALHRILFEDVDETAAMQEARSIGMKPELEPVIVRLLQSFRTENPELACP